MIKARGKGPGGHETLFIGLSFGNLERFKAHPLDSYIHIIGSQLDLPFDIMIFSGETEADMVNLVEPQLGADAKIHISDRSKN